MNRRSFLMGAAALFVLPSDYMVGQISRTPGCVPLICTSDSGWVANEHGGQGRTEVWEPIPGAPPEPGDFLAYMALQKARKARQA